MKNLKQLFEEYKNEIQYTNRLRPETIRGYANVFHLFLKVMPEVSTIESLSEEILKEFFKRIHTRERVVGKDKIKIGVKPSTIKTQFTKLNSFFSWMVKKSYIDENPLKKMSAPKVSYKDFPRLKDGDVNKIYASISLHSRNSLIQRRDTCMVSILALAGLRKGEFISLRVCDVDIEKREMMVRGETSKSKESRTLAIHPTLLLHIKDYIRERNLHHIKTEQLIVSSKSDRGLSRDGLKHWVESLKKKSGVRFHLHQFRHTFACKLAEANVNLFKIQEMMGHIDIRMTTKYTRSMKTEDMGPDIGKISFS